jgi:hypothetical protein
MTFELTSEQWELVQKAGSTPVMVRRPASDDCFVLLPSTVYEQLKALAGPDAISPQERQFQLQEFGRRAGWDDPGMDVYEDLNPRAGS